MGNAMKKVFKWGSMLVGSLIVVYVVWVIIAYNRVPTISVDYVAKLNEVAAAVPEEDRAWPLFREAGIALNKSEEPVDESYAFDYATPTWPSDEGWDIYQDWLDGHQQTLETIRQGAAKKGMGYLLSQKVAEEDKELWPDQYESQQSEQSYDGFVMSVLMPQLSHHRAMARLLMYDAKAAAYEGDVQRCKKDLDAMFSLAEHVREHPVLISDLVSLSIVHITLSTMSEIFSNEPFLFDELMLRDFKSHLGDLDASLEIRFEGERYFILDTLQRMYTDDGQGDGSIVPIIAAEQLAFVETVTVNQAQAGILPAAFAPLCDIFQASRKELLREYDRRIAMMEKRKGMTLAALLQLDDPFPAHESSTSKFLSKYFLIDLLLPALDGTVLLTAYAKGHVAGVLSIIYAIEQYQHTGSWPTTLEGAVVHDEWSEQPLLIAAGESHPVIYSVGADQDDDGGTHHKEAKNFDVNQDVDGDWVFWPPQE